MTPQDAFDFFGGRKLVAEICEVTDTAIYHWIRKGFIPYDKQCLLEIEARRRKGKKPIPIASREDAQRQAA